MSIEKRNFFVFGCWNRDNCDGDKKDYRKALIDKLILEPNKYDFGIIAGDNVYPHKKIGEKKIKNYYKHTLEYGFNDLLGPLKESTFDKKIYATIGNHDVEKDSILKYQITHNNIVMPNNMYMEKISDYLRIIFLDTNINAKDLIDKYKFTDKLDEFKTKEGNNFYNVKNSHDVLMRLNEYLDEEFYGWTIVIGHEPIFTFKKEKSSKLDNFQEILEKLASISRCVYMCADTHSFQAWNIVTEKHKSLPMIVVGTGGADPDDTTTQKLIFNSKANSLRLLESRYPYGYCDVKCDKNNLRIKYVPLDLCTEKEGNDSIIKFKYDKDIKIMKKTTREKISNECKAIETLPKLCELEGEIMNGGKKKMKNLQ
jgi:hypothetical protein